jgi:hypothetical protein
MIPAAPRETLARGFGDCKDKATLLIALLRRAGFTADVALLSTGPGWDVDPALPGQGGFDHAIVRVVVAGKDLWIDATEDLLPVGQLPVRDQGRRALIAGPGVRALVTTPSGGPADNLVREVRDYHLAELDGARVVETSTQTGVFADDLRGWVRRTARADLEDALRGYVDGRVQRAVRPTRALRPRRRRHTVLADGRGRAQRPGVHRARSGRGVPERLRRPGQAARHLHV